MRTDSLRKRMAGYASILLIACLFISFAPTITVGEESHAFEKEDHIRVVLDEDYPPFSFRDSQGNLQGILIDQWRIWEKKTGIKVDLYGMPWDECQQFLLQGRADIIDTLFYSKERSLTYDFSSSGIRIDVPTFFSPRISGITDVRSLAGFSVAVKKGDNCIHVLEANGVTNLQEFESYADIIRAYRDKEIVIFAMDEPSAFYYIHKMGLQERVRYSDPMYTGYMHRAVLKGNEALLARVDQGFAMIPPETFRAIDTKWRGHRAVTTLYLRYAAWASLIMLSVLFVLLLWNKALQRQVMFKTAQMAEALASLGTSEAKYRNLIMNLQAGIMVFSPTGELVFINQVARRILRLGNDEELTMYRMTKEWRFMMENGCDALPHLMAAETSQTGIILGIRRVVSDNITWAQVKVIPERTELGTVSQFVVTLVDITSLKQTEARLQDLLHHDSLTGLYNRIYFEKTIKRLTDVSLTSCGVVMCDLDGLKLINDTLGHDAGDQYLVRAARVLAASFRPEDIIARIGGDEFAVIMPDAEENEVREALGRMEQMLEDESSGEGSLPLGMSFSYSFRSGCNLDLFDMQKEADNYMYRTKLHRSQSIKSEIVRMTMELLKARDLVTENHAERVQVLATRLAEAVGMRGGELADIRLLAEFHDIGKVGIPDDILHKPGRLTADEQEQMRKHAEIGARIAAASADLAPIADWILSHHEWWNGQGYPLGLKGDEIPIQSRIIAIVDAYDAMVNDRPYRQALTHEEAIAELVRQRGYQFDPVLVDHFVALFGRRQASA